MITSLRFGIVCAFLTAVAVAPGADQRADSSTRVAVDLVDGSHIVGVLNMALLPVQTAYGLMVLPLTSIEKAQFSGGGKQAVLKFRNGDRLTCSPRVDTVDVSTTFGRYSIEIGHITMITVPVGLWAEWLFSGNAKDSSGNGHHGVVQGASLAEDRFGNANEAYAFDGQNDFIDLCDFPSGSDLTVSAWVEGYGGWYVIGGHPQFQKVWFIGCVSNGGSYATLRYQQNEESPKIDGNKTLVADGKWHHLVGVIGANGSALYVDGILEGKNRERGLWSGGPITIGRESHEFDGHFFNGTIDDVRLYDVALPEEDIKALYDRKD